MAVVTVAVLVLAFVEGVPLERCMPPVVSAVTKRQEVLKYHWTKHTHTHTQKRTTEYTVFQLQRQVLNGRWNFSHYVLF